MSATLTAQSPPLNRVISRLLRSPLHRLLDRWLLLLTVSGRRTGRAYTLPVQYARRGDALYVLPGRAAQKTWWRNLRGGAPVLLHLSGRDSAAWGEVLGGEAAIAAMAELAGTSLARAARVEEPPIVVTLRHILPVDQASREADDAGNATAGIGSRHGLRGGDVPADRSPHRPPRMPSGAGAVNGLSARGSPASPWPQARRPPRLLRSDAYLRLRFWLLSHHGAGPTIAAIKAVHTAIFLGLLSCVLHVTYSGLRGRITRGTRRSLVAVGAEALVFGLSGRRCPLTAVVEDLGAEHGQVTDLFLPHWVADHIFEISATLLGVGAAAFGIHRLDARRLRQAVSRARCR
jgi:hypothetical protein